MGRRWVAAELPVFIVILGVATAALLGVPFRRSMTPSTDVEWWFLATSYADVVSLSARDGSLVTVSGRSGLLPPFFGYCPWDGPRVMAFGRDGLDMSPDPKDGWRGAPTEVRLGRDQNWARVNLVAGGDSTCTVDLRGLRVKDAHIETVEHALQLYLPTPAAGGAEYAPSKVVFFSADTTVTVYVPSGCLVRLDGAWNDTKGAAQRRLLPPMAVRGKGGYWVVGDEDDSRISVRLVDGSMEARGKQPPVCFVQIP